MSVPGFSSSLPGADRGGSPPPCRPGGGSCRAGRRCARTSLLDLSPALCRGAFLPLSERCSHALGRPSRADGGCYPEGCTGESIAPSAAALTFTKAMRAGRMGKMLRAQTREAAMRRAGESPASRATGRGCDGPASPGSGPHSGQRTGAVPSAAAWCSEGRSADCHRPTAGDVLFALDPHRRAA